MVQQIQQRPKKIIRSCQRAWNKYRQPHYWTAYTRERNIYNRWMAHDKWQTITKKILDCKNDSKQLFSVVNSITNSKPSNPQSENKSDEEIAYNFAEFFIEKIQKIICDFTHIEEIKPVIIDIPQLRCFAPLMMEEVQKEMMSMRNRSCGLDIIATELLKEMLPSCIEIITHIMNISLTKGLFADDWKTAIVYPLLKSLAWPNKEKL